MKRLIIPILLLSLFLFGCSNETNKNVNNEKIQEENTIVLNDDDIKIINDTIVLLTKETAYQNAIFKIEMSEKNTNYLKLSVINPIIDIMSYFNVSTADDTVKYIRKSLIFDTVYDNVKSSIDKNFEGMTIYFYDNEEFYNKNEFYTLKGISNK